MTACEHTREIGAYHDGELPPGQAKQMARHLRECQACRQELDRLPDRVARVIRQNDMQAGPTLADIVARQELGLDWPLQGHAIKNLTVLPAVEPAVQERRP